VPFWPAPGQAGARTTPSTWPGIVVVCCAPEGTPYQVRETAPVLFISYSRKDHELAERLAAGFDRAGHEFWIDRRDINVGDPWSADIEGALKRSVAVVVIISRSSVSPESYVRREISYAALLGKPIYPLLAEQVAVSDLPMDIATLERIDCVDDFARGVDTLLRHLRPPETGSCSIEIVPGLRASLQPQSIEYAIMSRLPATRVLSVKEEITSGNSGSKVYFVDAAFTGIDAPPSPHFLKINNAQSDEPLRRYRLAAKTRLASHMPRLADATPWDETTKRIGLLYALSGARGGYASLGSLLRQNLGQAACAIRKVCEALAAWNEAGRRSKNLDAYELLARGLSHSLEPDSRRNRLGADSESGIFARAERLVKLTPGSSLLNFEHRHGLPNPLSYLADNSLWQIDRKAAQVTFPNGNIHGDLHVGNIQAIYGSRNRADRASLSISLIDFDTYDPDNSAFIDFASLELSLIIHLFGVNEESEYAPFRYQMLEQLSEYLATTLEINEEIPDLDITSVGLCAVLRPLRQVVATIADVHYDYDAAFWIARVAAGLQLLRRRKASYRERICALLFAADSLQYLVRKELVLPPKGAVASLGWRQAPDPS
jgi:TIR domain-containing protein